MLLRIETKLSARAARWRGVKTVRRLVRQEDGATAIEFGIVAAPFLALVFAIIETAVIFFAGQALETAVSDSARLIMTGQAQAQNLTQTTFKDKVCAKIYGLFNCANGMSVDVRTYTSFATASAAKPVDSNGDFVDNFTYSPGGPGQIVVVRLMYQWPVYVSLLGFNLADISGGKRLLMATAVFRNEPFTVTAPPSGT
jgi:Flp pilus assembly protein TadG